MTARVLYVVAGELSGDAHGAGLLSDLRGHIADLEIHGAGGPEMAAITGSGLENWVADAAVMGAWEVLRRYGWFREKFHAMLADVERLRPEVLLLIDYPGFNLRFAAKVRERLPKTRIVYYISPQVWAWNKGRLPKMARLLDEMLCLFPFEKPIFEGAGLRTTWVGHPLVDELEAKRIPHSMREPDLIGLFPGSREREIARLFPMMVQSAARMRAERPHLRFEVPAATPELAVIIRSMAAGVDGIRVTDGGSQSLMQRAGCAVVASGTATLEAAYYGLPYCLVYAVAWPTYQLARILVKIEHIGLVNILAGREVVREFIQGEANPANVSAELCRLTDDAGAREQLIAALAETTAKLGGLGAHARAADRVAAWFADSR
ncbi:MAG: lipid-A-disaccharide synthase [Luteolibacter sp.]